jgi:hypothetical protein
MSFINNGMMASQGIAVNSRKMLPYIAAVGPVEGSTAAFQPTMPAHQEGDLLILIVESSNTSASITLDDPLWEIWYEMGTGGTPNSGTICTFSTFRRYARHSSETCGNVNNGGSDHAVCQIIVIRGLALEPGTVNSVFESQFAQQTTNASPTFNDKIDSTLLARVIPGLVIWLIGSASDSNTAVISDLTNSALVNITEHSDTGNTAGNGGHIAIYSGHLLNMPAVPPANTTFVCAVNAGICAAEVVFQTPT